MNILFFLLSMAVNSHALPFSNASSSCQDTIPVAQDTVFTAADSVFTVQDTMFFAVDSAFAEPDTFMNVCDTLVDARQELILPRTLTVLCTGDVMPGTNYPSSRYLPPRNDCLALFSDALPYIKEADVAAGNLEGVFSEGSGQAKTCRDTLNCYTFRMPDSYAACIEAAGYDLLSVANNHVNDFGAGGRVHTAEVLDRTGMHYAGFTTHPWAVFVKDSVRYGFAAFAPHTGTMDLKQYARAAEIVKMLDDSCDIVIVSFHGGAEGRDHQHVVKGDEEFLGYNRGSVYRFAHTVIDAGADIVYGHGPHVVRAMELYKDRLICYSLGNFCTYARFNLSGPNALAPAVKITVDENGTFLEGKIIPFLQTGEGGPRYDPSGRAITKIRELTLSDLPDQAFEITDEGVIKRK